MTSDSDRNLPALWSWLSASVAVLAAAGSAIALLVPEPIYGRETAALADAAIAQDLVNLFLVAPLMLILAARAYRGSLLSRICLIGFLGFTAYNYALYAFSIHFGPLFLVWVAVLGASVFAMAGTLAASTAPMNSASLTRSGFRLPGWFLIVAASLFALLWLSAVVPDLIAGRPSSSASVWDVPTDPVHVLDLALFLPAVCAIGVLLLRRHRLGWITAPAALLFFGLTSLPILVTPFIAQARGDTPVWLVMAPIGAVAVASLAVLWRLLRTMRTQIVEDAHGRGGDFTRETRTRR
jgi:hypothetical protein